MSSDRLTGRVKWFNSKSGFGFVTVCDGPHKDKDIFTHFTSLRGDSAQYKYLVQGEYVEFLLSKSESEQHEFIATDVGGVKGGLLMCDTHRLNSTTRPAAPRSDSRPAAPRSDSRPFSEVKRRPLRPTAIAKKV
jgi:CspA family cold shock protein